MFKDSCQDRILKDPVIHLLRFRRRRQHVASHHEGGEWGHDGWSVIAAGVGAPGSDGRCSRRSGSTSSCSNRRGRWGRTGRARSGIGATRRRRRGPPLPAGAEIGPDRGGRNSSPWRRQEHGVSRSLNVFGGGRGRFIQPEPLGRMVPAHFGKQRRFEAATWAKWSFTVHCRPSRAGRRRSSWRSPARVSPGSDPCARAAPALSGADCRPFQPLSVSHRSLLSADPHR